MPDLAGTVEDIEFEVLEGAAEPTSDDYRLHESAQITEGAVAADGSVLLHLIRPCVGRGRGKHLYPAQMLEANAAKFVGWKMYLNHLSDQARRALGGLPRDVRDAGGIVTESWWDPDVPADGRFGQGAVVGKVKPVELIQKLIAVDPRLVEASINATATAVKRGKVGDEQVWIVEGIEEKGSVDWVTEAGAGGRVASIMEALMADDSRVESAYLESLDDDTLGAWIEEHRPDLSEALKAKKKPPKGDPDEGETDDDNDAEDQAELAAMVKKFTSRGIKQAAAEKMAKAAIARKKKVTEGGGDGLPDITPEVLVEALTSDEGQAALADAVADAIRGLNLGAEVTSLVEARLEQDREVIRAEAEARADRRNQLRDMRDRAQRRIAESKLHDVLKEQVAARFDLVEGVPTPGLDVLDDTDETGAVTKSATAKLDEAVDAALKEGLRIQGALSPTRVRGQGMRLVEANSNEEGDGKKDGGEGDGKKDKPDRVGDLTRQLLTEGVTADRRYDPEKAFEHAARMPVVAGG